MNNLDALLKAAEDARDSGSNDEEIDALWEIADHVRAQANGLRGLPRFVHHD